MEGGGDDLVGGIEQPSPGGLGELPAVERRGVDAVALEVVGGVVERSAGAAFQRCIGGVDLGRTRSGSIIRNGDRD